MSKIQSQEFFGKPLCYYALSLFWGSYVYTIISEHKILGAVLAASFLLIIFKSVKFKFAVIILVFFILGYTNTYLYYEKGEPKEDKIFLRVIENKDYSGVAKYGNKKIIIKGNLKGLEEGTIVQVNGEFSQIKDYNRGAIGEFDVTYGEVVSKDIVYKTYALKSNLYEKFSEYLGEERSAIVMALCFGEDKYMGTNEKSNLQEMGVMHAACVSGFHMAVVFKSIEFVGGLNVGIVFSFIYMIFTGGKPSTIRAFIMIFLMKFSAKIFRNYDNLSALSLAALIILLVKPYSATDIGFALSFLSVLGILFYNSKLNRILYKLPGKLNETVSLSLSSQVFSMPLAALVFERVSTAFILGNLIILPMFSIIILVGNISFLFYKVNLLFILFCNVLKIIFTSYEGAQYLLLKITPSMAYLSYIDVLAYVSILLCYMLIKTGYKNLLYFPVVLVIIVGFQNYRFFPEISYINISSYDCILIRYKNESVLLSENLDKVENIKFPLSVKRKINEVDNFYMILGKKYKIYSLKKDSTYMNEKDFDKVNLVYDYNHKKTLISSQQHYSISFIDNLKAYDIIKVPNNKKYNNYGDIYGQYIILGNKIISII